MFDQNHYVPILKWRLGEYQALMRTTPEIKSHITPLIEVPPIEWDFEEGKLKKSLQDHLTPFAKRVADKWGKNPIFVDLALIDLPRATDDGMHAVTKIFRDLRDKGVQAIPVTSLASDGDYQSATRDVVNQDQRGLAVRVTLEELAVGLDGPLSELVTQIDQLTLEELDLVVDLGTPNFRPIDNFADLLWSLVDASSSIQQVRTFTIAATAFPESMERISSFVEIISRDEWLLYKRMIDVANEGQRMPTFGDYAIAHPVLPRRDMRFLRPSASLRYTIDDAWRITKGSNVRDFGFEQYEDICADLTSASEFAGEDLSYGDDYISKCALGIESTGNLTTWRGVGTNHHLAKVVQDISNLYAP